MFKFNNKNTSPALKMGGWERRCRGEGGVKPAHYDFYTQKWYNVM